MLLPLNLAFSWLCLPAKTVRGQKNCFGVTLPNPMWVRLIVETDFTSRSKLQWVLGGVGGTPQPSSCKDGETVREFNDRSHLKVFFFILLSSPTFMFCVASCCWEFLFLFLFFNLILIKMFIWVCILKLAVNFSYISLHPVVFLGNKDQYSQMLIHFTFVLITN